MAKKLIEVSYPTYRFNKAGQSVKVEDETADKALQGEWFDHPPTADEVDDRFEYESNVEHDETDDMIAEEASVAPKRKKK